MPDRARGVPSGPAHLARGAADPQPGRRPALGSGRSLSDLLDRVVDAGAVVSGDVIIGLAGVDLIRLDLRLLLIGAQSAIEAGAGAELRPAPASDGSRAIDGVVLPDVPGRGRGDVRAEP
jgi:hypothetical protein